MALVSPWRSWRLGGSILSFRVNLPTIRLIEGNETGGIEKRLRFRGCDGTGEALPTHLVVDDRELIAGTLAGHQADFEALVERYQRMLYAFVYRSLQDADAADEVVQETFVQAYRHLARFRGEASFKTWLHQIALNFCRARFRASRARHEVSLDEVPESALPRAETNPMAGAELSLRRHVARLPPRQRAVLTLRVYSDLSFKEIGRIEGISENSAKVSFHHAITRLKQWLARES